MKIEDILTHPAKVLTPASHTGDIVRGHAAQTAHLDPAPCPVPPDWGKIGYGSIFSMQHAGKAS